MSVLQANIDYFKATKMKYTCDDCGEIFPTRGHTNPKTGGICKNWTWLSYKLNHPVIDGHTLSVKPQYYKLFYSIFEVTNYTTSWACDCNKCGATHTMQIREENKVNSLARIYLIAIRYGQQERLKELVGEKKFSQMATRGLKKTISGSAI